MGRGWDGAGTAAPYRPPCVMVSFVLRLVAEYLENGVLAGEVQVVQSGERIIVRDGTELLSVLRGGRDAMSPTEEER